METLTEQSLGVKTLQKKATPAPKDKVELSSTVQQQVDDIYRRWEMKHLLQESNLERKGNFMFANTPHGRRIVRLTTINFTDALYYYGPKGRIITATPVPHCLFLIFK